MTKEKEKAINTAISTLKDLESTFVNSSLVIVMPHDRITIIQNAITLLEEYKKIL